MSGKKLNYAGFRGFKYRKYIFFLDLLNRMETPHKTIDRSELVKGFHHGSKFESPTNVV